jgi:Ca2+/Na+ antiporter
MDWKTQIRTGSKAAGAMAAINLLILGFMMVIGYNTTPLDPSGVEIPIVVFAIATMIGGGIVPGLIGTVTWVKVNERWSEQSRVLFTLLALVIASFMTLPFTNPRVPTGDAYVLTAVLHYSTAILGSWFIPYFSNADKSAGHE